ncbi:Thioesterase protein [Acididesulfobacillus acetoxydans]|nr:thioesterase family protein [Acididesulfobacillus acetoxydans]CEJ06937.1 Thioesterase protein [Acididesulfobacillus acetoxydans]
MDLPLGIKGERRTEVSAGNTAKAMGSGLLEVFATPAMIALMEGAAVQALEPYQASSVGTALEVRHLAATPLGMRVRAVAQLIEVERRRLVFSVEAFDEVEKIGEGRHERFLIQDEAFLKKVYAKNAPGERR